MEMSRQHWQNNCNQNDNSFKRCLANEQTQKFLYINDAQKMCHDNVFYVYGDMAGKVLIPLRFSSVPCWLYWFVAWHTHTQWFTIAWCFVGILENFVLFLRRLFLPNRIFFWRAEMTHLPKCFEHAFFLLNQCCCFNNYIWGKLIIINILLNSK